MRRNDYRPLAHAIQGTAVLLICLPAMALIFGKPSLTTTAVFVAVLAGLLSALLHYRLLEAKMTSAPEVGDEMVARPFGSTFWIVAYSAGILVAYFALTASNRGSALWLLWFAGLSHEVCLIPAVVYLERKRVGRRIRIERSKSALIMMLLFFVAVFVISTFLD